MGKTMEQKVKELAEELKKEFAKDGEPITDDEAFEMATMELGAKEIKNYVSADKTKRKTSKPKTVKVSDEKKSLFDTVFSALSQKYGENAQISKENKLIIVQIAQKTFKIDVIEQRKPK